MVGVLKPEVIFALPGINPDLMNSLINNLVSEEKYIHLDMNRIVEFAKKRGTAMGKRFAAGKECSVKLNIEQLKRILFNNPNNMKFVITNFSTNLDDYKKFESEVCPVDKVIYCTVPAEEVENPFLP